MHTSSDFASYAAASLCFSVTESPFSQPLPLPSVSGGAGFRDCLNFVFSTRLFIANAKRSSQVERCVWLKRCKQHELGTQGYSQTHGPYRRCCCCHPDTRFLPPSRGLRLTADVAVRVTSVGVAGAAASRLARRCTMRLAYEGLR